MIKAMIINTSGIKTLPSDLIQVIKIIAIGGGGAGHGFYNTASTGGSGGGGGGCAINVSNIPTSTFIAGSTFYVQIGAGGASNTDYYYAPSGENTWINYYSNQAPEYSSQGLLARGGGGGSLYGSGTGGSSNIGQTTYNGGAGGNGTALTGGGGGGGAGGPVAAGGSGGVSGILFYNMNSGYSPGAGGGGGGSGYNTGATNINTGNGVASPSFYPTASIKGGGNGGGVFPRNGTGGIHGNSQATSIAPTTGSIDNIDTQPLGLRGGGGGGGGGVLYAGSATSAPGANGANASMVFVNQTINSVLTVNENYSGGGGGGGGGGGTIFAAFAVNAPSCGPGGSGGLYGGGGGGGNIGGAGASGVVVIFYEAIAKKLWAEAETGTIIIGSDIYLGEPGVRPPEVYINNPLAAQPYVGTPYVANLNFSTNLIYLRSRTKVFLSTATFPALSTDSISWDESQGGCH